jgi:hypothetical protein
MPSVRLNDNEKGVSALKRAKAQVGKKCLLGINYCLYNVQEWFKSGHYWASAIEQWNKTKDTNKVKNDKKPPKGTPVFFEGGKYGHIAIATGTGENIVSTDYPNKGYIGITTISKLAKAWGYKYLGWTKTIGNNTTIYTAPKNNNNNNNNNTSPVVKLEKYICIKKTKMFKSPNTKSPLLKNGKKVFRDKGYTIKAYAYSKNWLKTNKGNYYIKKRFK